MRFQLIVDPDKEETVVATVHASNELTKKIEMLVMEYTGSDKLAAYREDEMRLLSFDDIACITVQDGKTYAIDNHGLQYRLKQRLYELEAILPHTFFRINKSTLANERHLERFHVGYSGAVDAIFRCGYREYVSRRCLAVIKRRFQL